MGKKHSQFSSAFAIGEMAVLSLDNFGENKVPYGVIEGVMFYGDQRLYRVSLFVNDGPKAAPEAFLHQGRPVDCFQVSDLIKITDTQYIDHIGHVGKFERAPRSAIAGTPFSYGELVEVKIDTERTDHDAFNIPVMITGVQYDEGKVLYDVSIQRAYYEDGRVNGGRLVRDTLTGIDSIYIKPIGGWEAYETLKLEAKTDGDVTLTIKGDGTLTVDSDVDIVITADSIRLEEPSTNTLIVNDLFDQAYDAHLNGVQCGENNKEAARSFLAQYIGQLDERLANYRATKSERVSGLAENPSNTPKE